MKKVYESKYLVINTEYNCYEKFEFEIFKHCGTDFFSRYSKVIDFTLFRRRLIIEF